MIRLGVFNAVVVAVALVATAPVQAQRATLAERVAQLEQQANQPGDRQQAMDTLNRINELQAELAIMRGQVEQLQFELQEMQRRNRDQYIDLDSRIERLQGGAQGGTRGDAMDAGERGDELPMEAPALGRSPQAPSPQVGTRVDVAGEDTDLAAGPAGDPADERAAYEAGFDALKDGRYAESARRFQAFIESYPDGQYAANAWYWLGESYYVTQNFELAKDAFQSLLQQHPNSAKAPDALLKLGYCQYELRDFDAAQATLNQVVQRYPDTTVARLAQGRLRALMLESR